MSTLIFLSLSLLSMAFCFSFLTHPLASGLALIMQTILVCNTATLISGMSWFSYILFLIFLGATLVLFIYVASLASNEMFKINFKLTIILLLPLLTIPVLLFSETLILPNKETLETSFFWSPQEITSIQFKLNSMYNPTSANLTAVIILYLLLSLVIIVKLSSSFFGPLRLS
ncbi:NADH dehydrogenase subunit 6 (mitochondrion) [Palaemon carinicauda]|uniref:NADH-ubiquinone oxidoreductase chain 6 n=1 Tax=Palaemon carinicauda TaxID=392227 RepID=C1I1Z2_PALCI|nr:NADH dehydrogenase subunit 6 [Palaemon carinicauda]ABQ63421.1 NADH dehydrogenase subunit 6 [Palaemon carinicauda]